MFFASDVDNNTADMKNLVESLAIFFHATEKDKREISADDIARYALQTRGEDGGTLFSAIADGDLEHAEMIASSIISSDSQAPLKAFATIVSRFRQLESFEELRARGFSEKEAFDQLSGNPEWKGRQILAPMRSRMDYAATDDLELYQEYVRSMEEVRDWVKENMADPEKLPSMVSA